MIARNPGNLARIASETRSRRYGVAPLVRGQPVGDGGSFVVNRQTG